MTIIFSTRAFEYEYGKRPRGRGWWAFSFKGQQFFYTGMYSEAKKACAEHIKSMSDELGDYVIVKVDT